MAVRIYADVKGGKCPCGGSFTKRVEHSDHEGLMVPKCNQCNKYPAFFVVDADGVDANGNKIKLRIRSSKEGKRFNIISRVTYALEDIQKELLDGTFDIRNYDSEEAKTAFLFKNFIERYLKHHRDRLQRGEITPKALKDKEGLIKRELLPYFKDVAISKISKTSIKNFRNSYTDKFRTRDLALGELKTILNYALDQEMITIVPPFDKIPRARKRREVISMELAKKTISLMSNKLYRDMYTILTIYPIRPSELRAIKWKDIDLENDRLIIERHFSDEVDIDGRKSISDIDEARMKFPLMPEAKAIFKEYWPEVVPIGFKEEYVFKSIHGKHIDGDVLSHAWRIARKLAGHEHQAYELRHARLSELSVKTGGNIPALLRASGHSNPKTLMDRYVRDETDLREILS